MSDKVFIFRPGPAEIGVLNSEGASGHPVSSALVIIRHDIGKGLTIHACDLFCKPVRGSSMHEAPQKMRLNSLSSVHMQSRVTRLLLAFRLSKSRTRASVSKFYERKSSLMGTSLSGGCWRT